MSIFLMFPNWHIKKGEIFFIAAFASVSDGDDDDGWENYVQNLIVWGGTGCEWRGKWRKSACIHVAKMATSVASFSLYKIV